MPPETEPVARDNIIFTLKPADQTSIMPYSADNCSIILYSKQVHRIFEIVQCYALSHIVTICEGLRIF